MANVIPSLIEKGCIEHHGSALEVTNLGMQADSWMNEYASWYNGVENALEFEEALEKLENDEDMGSDLSE